MSFYQKVWEKEVCKREGRERGVRGHTLLNERGGGGRYRIGTTYLPIVSLWVGD